jgi:hypothetical protein
MNHRRHQHDDEYGYWTWAWHAVYKPFIEFISVLLVLDAIAWIVTKLSK